MEETKTAFVYAIANVSTYDEFENMLSTQTSKIKGKYFELFCKLYFALLPVHKGKEIYLYRDIPHGIKRTLELPNRDKGIDGVLIALDLYYVIQIKYRANKLPIPFGQLSTFPGLAFGSNCKNISGGILFTNCYDVCAELKGDRYTNVTHSALGKCDAIFWDNVRMYLRGNSVYYPIMQPLPHQDIILSLARKYYEEHNYGKIYSPCGTGKTFLGYWIAINMLKCRRTFIMVPSLYLLSETYEAWASQLHNTCYRYLLICSDVDNKTNVNCEYNITTDKLSIMKDLRANPDNVIVIATYQSSKVFKDACEEIGFHFDIGIYDEAHRTTGTNDKLFTNILAHDWLCRRRLFLTATEKKYDGHLEEDTIYSMDNVKIYGEVIYNYSLSKAIEDNQLADYKIIAPFVSHSCDYRGMLKNRGYVDLNDSECGANIILLAIMIIDSIRENRIRHLLIFSNRNEHAKKIINVIKILLNDVHIYCKYLDGTSNMNKRKYKVHKFEKADIGIISSAKIFSEGVNIPVCDGVCFADNKCSTIDIIQCVGRCLRKCKSIPNKISHVIVPFVLENPDNFFDSESPAFNKIRNVLKSMGTTDEMVADKFTVMNCEGHAKINNNACHNESVSVGHPIDVNDFTKAILLKIFDRGGNPENVIRNKIIAENKMRYINGLALIDTQDKCIAFLTNEGETDMPSPTNWVKYCLGNDIFAIIKKKYYYDKNDIKDACAKLGITDMRAYRDMHELDPMLPTIEYINDGFYGDLTASFNLMRIFDRCNNKGY